MRGGELILWPLERRLLLRQRFEPTDFEGRCDRTFIRPTIGALGPCASAWCYRLKQKARQSKQGMFYGASDSENPRSRLCQ